MRDDREEEFSVLSGETYSFLAGSVSVHNDVVIDYSHINVITCNSVTIYSVMISYFSCESAFFFFFKGISAAW